MGYRAVFLASLVLASTFAAEAARPEINHVRVVVKHYDRQVELWDRGTLRTVPLREEIPLRLGENEEMTLIVEQTNPLLFTYDIKDGPSTDNASYAAALKFQEVLKKVSEVLGVTGTDEEAQVGGREQSAGARVVMDAGFTPKFVQAFGDNVEEIRAAVKSLTTLVARSGRSWNDARVVKNEVAAWTATLDETEQQLQTIREADEALYDFARGARPAPLPKKQKTEETSQPDNDDSFNDTSKKNGATPQSELTIAGEAQVTEGESAAAGEDRLLLAFDYVVRHAGEVGDAIDELRKFQQLAGDIGTPIEKENISASVQQDRSQILTVTTKEGAAEAAAKAQPKAGSYKFLIRPETAVEYEFIEPAVVYSLVEREDWGTEPVDGGFEIVKKDDGNESNGTTLAGMLSVTPTALRDWSFAPSFQVGFSPVKDRFGIFAGLSFRVFDLFKLGGGIAYQQAEQLSNEQHAGQILTSADDLDVETKPDTGFYFGLTLDLGKKK